MKAERRFEAVAIGSAHVFVIVHFPGTATQRARPARGRSGRIDCGGAGVVVVVVDVGDPLAHVAAHVEGPIGTGVGWLRSDRPGRPAATSGDAVDVRHDGSLATGRLVSPGMAEPRAAACRLLPLGLGGKSCPRPGAVVDRLLPGAHGECAGGDQVHGHAVALAGAARWGGRHVVGRFGQRGSLPTLGRCGLFACCYKLADCAYKLKQWP